MLACYYGAVDKDDYDYCYDDDDDCALSVCM